MAETRERERFGHIREELMCTGVRQKFVCHVSLRRHHCGHCSSESVNKATLRDIRTVKQVKTLQEAIEKEVGCRAHGSKFKGRGREGL